MLLHTQQLVCQRGALRLFTPVSLQLAVGDALFIEGPNGSGKSTLLRTLGGLFVNYQGQFSVFAPTLYFGHKNALQPNLTVAEHVRFWSQLNTTPAPATLLSVLGLEALSHARAETLSQGQQRRLALARLIPGNAPIWLLDEPHAALDSGGISLLQSLIAQHRAMGGGVMIASHGGLELDGSMAHRLQQVVHG